MNETGQRFCTNCGSELRPGAAFCTSCGAATSSAAATEPVSPPTEQIAVPATDVPTRVVPTAVAPPAAAPQVAPQEPPPPAAPGAPIEATGTPVTASTTPNVQTASSPQRNKAILIGAAIAAAVIVVGVAAFVLFGSGGDDDVSADGDDGAVATISVPTTTRSTRPREESTLPRRSTTTMRPTTTAYVGPPVEITPYGASASATDANGTDECTPPNNTAFPASNLFDGDVSTAWRVNGNGTGATVTVDFGETVALSNIGLIPGYAKRDPCSGVDRFPQGYRIASVTYTFDDGSVEQQSFADSPTMQSIPVDVTTSRVLVTVTGVREPRFPVGSEERREKTAISEMSFFGTAR